MWLLLIPALLAESPSPVQEEVPIPIIGGPCPITWNGPETQQQSVPHESYWEKFAEPMIYRVRCYDNHIDRVSTIYAYTAETWNTLFDLLSKEHGIPDVTEENRFAWYNSRFDRWEQLLYEKDFNLIILHEILVYPYPKWHQRFFGEPYKPTDQKEATPNKAQ